MKLKNVIIAWNPKSAEVECGPWPDLNDWSDKYQMTSGMCYTSWQEAPLIKQLLLMFIEFNTMVVRDQVDPEAAHQAFLEIDEYRELIPEDQRGAYRGGVTELHQYMLNIERKSLPVVMSEEFDLSPGPISASKA